MEVAVLDLVCAMHGRRLIRLKRNTYGVDSFTVVFNKDDICVYDKLARTSFTFMDVGNITPSALFAKLFRGAAEILHRQAPPPIILPNHFAQLNIGYDFWYRFQPCSGS